jgi:hypothetical protein
MGGEMVGREKLDQNLLMRIQIIMEINRVKPIVITLIIYMVKIQKLNSLDVVVDIAIFSWVVRPYKKQQQLSMVKRFDMI